MWRVNGRSIEVGLGIWQRYPYPRLVELVALAEDAGYDVLWCGNEKFYRDMWVTLGLVAAHARRARVGTFVAEPYTFHPALMAAAIATADEAAGGRAILLLGAGATGFAELGLRRERPVTMLDETIEVVRRLLRGETVTFEGRCVAVHDAHLDFEARADLPIWIASRGNKMLAMAGRRADGIMIATYATPAGIRAALREVALGAAEAGRDMHAFPVHARVDLCLDDDETVARATVKPMIAGMIKASYPNRDFIRQAGLDLPDDLTAELVEQRFGGMAAVIDRLPESFVDAFSWAGTPHRVAEKVAAVLDMGIDRVTILPHTSQGTASAERMVERFAREVMPQAVALMGGTA